MAKVIKLFFYSFLLGIYFLSISPAHGYVHGKEGEQAKKECKVCEWQQSINASFSLPLTSVVLYQNFVFETLHKNSVYILPRQFTHPKSNQPHRGPPIV